MTNNLIKKIGIFLKSFLKDPLFLSYWEETLYSRSKKEGQLSVRIVARNKRHRYSYNGDSFMFIEDLHTGIMPFMIYQGEREKYPARVEPASPEKELIISDGISGRSYSRFLSDALCDFIRTTTHVLSQDGVVIYEIIYKKNEFGIIESFELELLQPFYLFKFFGYYYQFVPWWEAKKSHTKVQIVKIPAEKIMRIDFPKQFGGKRKIKKILRRLWQLSKEIVPEFRMEAIKENKDIGFDLKEFSKVKYLEIAELTKDFGWSQRQYSDDYITEYYSMLRFLREKKVEATIREKIVSSLNKTLNGSLLNFGVSIVIDNLFSAEDVEEQKKILTDGNVAFIDIFNSLKM